jgi:glycosyltransferase involved in cell wall biosynthesis
MVLPLSVFIICKNEADRIHYPIESTRGWVDEIIVVDSGSSDGTMERAKELGADKVLYNEWKGYGPQKVYCETLCRNHWVLNLDADEAVSPALRTKIEALFAQGEPQNALYAINNVMVFPYETTPRRFSPSGYFVRLYRRDSAGFKDSLVHDSVVAKVPLPTIRIEEPVHHYGFRNYHHMIAKMNAYSDMQAEDMFQRRRKISSLRIFAEPFFAFFKAYLGRKYVLFGAEGFTHSLFYAFFRTIRLAKTRERYKIAALKQEPLDR